MKAISRPKGNFYFIRLILVLAVLLLLVYFFVYFPGQESSFEEEGRVIEVIDGDTIKLENGEKVRYIGVNTPEIKEEECFASEAKRKNEELVKGKIVKFKKDVSEKDSYGRLLRYVYQDDLFVNLFLVKEGFAVSFPWPPDLKYVDLLNQAEQKAKEENKGLWSECSRIK